MSLQSHLKKVAPLYDRYDIYFTIILLGLLTIGYATFVESASVTGLVTAWNEFIENSGLLALLTAWTAIVALYRLRHRPDKTRPSVREDFESSEGKNGMDFGLRNFGPGPALYIQAVATVEHDNNVEELTRMQVHDGPIHLRKGDFASLVRDVEENWIDEMAEEYDIEKLMSDDEESRDDPPMVNLYFSYVSQSGAREPNQISTSRNDENILDQIKEPDSEARHIELWRVVKMCQTST